MNELKLYLIQNDVGEIMTKNGNWSNDFKKFKVFDALSKARAKLTQLARRNHKANILEIVIAEYKLLNQEYELANKRVEKANLVKMRKESRRLQSRLEEAMNEVRRANEKLQSVQQTMQAD